MIHINRNIDPPGVLDSKNYGKLIKRLFKEGNKHQFSGYYINRVCKGLKQLYHHKCAYCETHVRAGTVLEYDHFRPKKGVKDSSHTGYFWLGYEWTNLVPACPNCNRAKSNHFPIQGERVESSAFSGQWNAEEAPKFKAGSPLLEAEKPLLLHPETDEPEKHLVFLGSGMLKGTTAQGEKTIEICGLNRDGLLLARRKLINGFLEEIRELLNDFITGEISKEILGYNLDRLFTRISKSKAVKNPYSRLGWYLFEHFDSFLVVPLSPKQRKVLSRAFELFKKRGSCRRSKSK